jgi:glucosamine--fructose-6-phosphate aminotransferase (isomerizing)
MCGIVGYVGSRNAAPILVGGLKRLEYRGYDSAGIALLDGNEAFTLRRAVGKLRALESVLEREPVGAARFGVGHTRWATHGRPSEENAHPHRDPDDRVVLVHNGIIENYLELKSELLAEGATFRSETDTEVVAHLVAREMRKGSPLETAVQDVAARLSGIYALCAMAVDDPGKIVGARLGPPLVAGVGKGENFLASDLTALLEHTRDIVFIEDNETVVITEDKVEVFGPDRAPRPLKVRHIAWDPVLAEKGGYRHFMLKEIHEQPRAINDTLAGRISLDRGEVFFAPDEFPQTDADLKSVERVYMASCGTSWHASLVGKFFLERLARVPAEVDYASEFRYRDPLVDRNTLITIVTQSGETADTLAALREAKARGARSIAVCNVMGSTATRESEGTILTHCGPEIGVASTKAFTAQLTALYLMALRIGAARGVLDRDAVRDRLTDIVHLPSLVERTLELDEAIQALARTYKDAKDFLYLGRGVNYPIALEGALKLKEISYIHAEGYPAGEMKHGPIALIDEQLPVVALAPQDAVFEKMLSNMEEVKARGGTLIVVTSEGMEKHLAGKADHVLAVPPAPEFITPALLVVPLQLLAYHIALLRGCDVDQPRNLAKSVTVE